MPVGISKMLFFVALFCAAAKTTVRVEHIDAIALEGFVGWLSQRIFLLSRVCLQVLSLWWIPFKVS